MTLLRVSLITGASSGIGAATARRLAGPGEALFLTARGGIDGKKIAALEAVADEVRAAGAQAETLLADLTIAGAGEAIVDSATTRFGQLDCIVSNAGYAVSGEVTATTNSVYQQSFQVIFQAFLDILRKAEPYLIDSPRARIALVSSFVVNQVPGGRAFPATAAAKGAVESLARTLAVEYATRGITVNCVAPGFTEKESQGHSALSRAAWEAAAAITPDTRLARPSDIAAAIAFFLSEEASHITGQTLRVDGGLSLI
ncbi:MAG: SDR family NAD(P)-dependent oxidoreductase [Granulosicoccus sp.]